MNAYHYVNREPQMRLLREALRHIRSSGPLFQTIFEFIGVPTIGKTTLINLLCCVCQDEGIPYAHIDFDAERNPHAHDYLESPALLLTDLAAQLSILDKKPLQKAVEEYERLITASEEKRRTALQNLAHKFREGVNQLSQQAPIVFLFDTTDEADPAVLSWLEEEVVSLLTQKGRCLFVFAGTAALHWRRFEVRRRVRTERLEPFKPESVEDQLKQDKRHPDLAQFSAQVYHLTGGLPMGNFVVSKRLGELADEGRLIDHEMFSSYEPTLLDALIRDVIKKYVFKGVDEDLVDACYVLSLVRQFDLILLRRLLSEFVEAFADYPRNAYGGLLGTLNATHLIEWDEKRKGYTVDPTLRRILSQHIRIQNPERYKAVNQAALEVYQDWIERVADYRSIYIVEALYQEACLTSMEPDRHFDDLLESLDRYLTYYQEDDREWLNSMLDRLGKELESDLDQERLGGLGEILPEETIEGLLSQITKKRRDTVKLSVN